MGTWSTRLFSSDTTCDVRDSYVKLLETNNDQDAYKKILEQFSEYMDGDEEPLVWFALAATMWRYGRLTEAVRRKALYWINAQGALDIWETNAQKKKWLEQLSKLQEQLNLPMLERKCVSPPKKFIHNPWSPGDIYAYQLHTEAAKQHGLLGKFFLLQKLGDDDVSCFGPRSIIQVNWKIYDTIPDIDEIGEFVPLPLISIEVTQLKKTETEEEYNRYLRSFYLAAMDMVRQTDYPKKHLFFVGNKPVPEFTLKKHEYAELVWYRDKLDSWLIEWFLGWNAIQA